MEFLKENLEEYLRKIKNLGRKKLILIGIVITIIASSFIFLDMLEGGDRYENENYTNSQNIIGLRNRDGGDDGGNDGGGDKEGAVRSLGSSGLQLGLIGAGMIASCLFFRNNKTQAEDIFVLGDKEEDDE